MRGKEEKQSRGLLTRGELGGKEVERNGHCATSDKKTSYESLGKTTIKEGRGERKKLHKKSG